MNNVIFVALFFVVTIATLALMFVVLWLQGGKFSEYGDLTFKLPPSSTRKGKLIRIELIAFIVVLTIEALVSALTAHDYKGEKLVLLDISFGGAAVSLGTYFLLIAINKKDK